jgi:hypothetical protein
VLQEQFDIIGFWENQIFFKLAEKVIALSTKLPKEDLILQLKIEPEDVKAMRDEILFQASRLPLTYANYLDLETIIYSQENQ